MFIGSFERFIEVMKKYAVITMDVEDWYHNDYFLDAKNVDRNYHMMDGLNVLKNILQENNIPATFFVLAEVLDLVKGQIIELDKRGCDIGCHGLTHFRPITMSTEEFRNQITKGKKIIEDTIGHEIIGYRAPTYGLDDARLQVVRDLGFKYDSSKNAFAQNPKYGHLNLEGFTEVKPNIYNRDDFCEFEISSQDFAGYKLPLGGGYLRMLFWTFNKHQLYKYAASGKFYVLYIHPFELSRKKVPYVADAGFSNRLRSTLGRNNVAEKVDKVIKFLKSQEYEFVTYRQLRDITLKEM